MVLHQGQPKKSINFLTTYAKKLHCVTFFLLPLTLVLVHGLLLVAGQGEHLADPESRFHSGAIRWENENNEQNEKGDLTMSGKNSKLPQILAAAAVMAAVSAVPAFAASGWQMEGDQWVYLDRYGDKMTDTWKKSENGFWFYLDDDGYMAVNRLVENGDDYYYVNEDGARVKNEWRKLEDDSDEEAYTDGTCWYYFGNDGKAEKNDSGRAKLTTINGKKYAFSDTGKMLYGWVSEDGAMVTDESDWASGLMYCGEEDDGAAALAKWVLLDVDDPEADSDAEGYWFYFGTNGKKTMDTSKTINGYKYQFDENGVAQFKWYTASDSTASASEYKYYNMPDQCWLADGWFLTVPTEEVDPEAYENDEEYWFYADKKGELVTSKIRSINNYKYAFNEKGEMLQGLYAITFDEDRNIATYEKIENIDEMPGADEEIAVYYFGNTPKDGVMATKKKVTVDLDDDSYEFGFRTNGEAINGISDNAIYVHGRKLKADKELKLETVEYGGEIYLINSSGTIQKNKTNTKDADDYYYCTDSKGIVTYSGSEKWTK